MIELFNDALKIDEIYSYDIKRYSDENGYNLIVEIESESNFKGFGSYRLIDFPLLDSINFKFNNDIYSPVSRIGIWGERYEDKDPLSNQEKEFNLYLYLDFDLSTWDKSYSFNTFVTNFSNELQKECESIDFEINNEDERKVFVIDFMEILPEESFLNVIEEKINSIKIVFDRIKSNFFENYQDKIIEGFNFPESLKISCGQYLLYFAQFLQDLGINATSNLEEEAGKVLFSVTPTDDVAALDKIREALAVYLNLPASQIVYDESFAAMRLHQQIDNLQHAQRMKEMEFRSVNYALQLAQQNIDNNQITIKQKDSIIEQQNKVIEKIQSKSIMMDSLENKEELEELYDGLKIGESKFLKEQLGIHLNPAKVIKTAVKNTFGKNEKKSVLGLEEDD